MSWDWSTNGGIKTCNICGKPNEHFASCMAVGLCGEHLKIWKEDIAIGLCKQNRLRDIMIERGQKSETTNNE